MQEARPHRVADRIETLITIIEFTLIARALFLLWAVPATFFFRISALLVWPFHGLLPTIEVGKAILDSSTAIGLIVYPLLGWLVIRVVDLVRYRQAAHFNLIK